MVSVEQGSGDSAAGSANRQTNSLALQLQRTVNTTACAYHREPVSTETSLSEHHTHSIALCCTELTARHSVLHCVTLSEVLYQHDVCRGVCCSFKSPAVQRLSNMALKRKVNVTLADSLLTSTSLLLLCLHTFSRRAHTRALSVYNNFH